jgi:hypothetical protein
MLAEHAQVVAVQPVEVARARQRDGRPRAVDRELWWAAAVVGLASPVRLAQATSGR